MQTIDKLSWIHIKNRKVLYFRSKGKDVFYTPGGKREKQETDKQALVREIKEELNVKLNPHTLKYLYTFKAQAHNKPKGIMVEIKCLTGDFKGELNPGAEIEELAWFNSQDMNRTSLTGQLALKWLKEQNLID